jgi:uncharacterized protein (DUF362 family)/Pyruvate/2-oxoacid:ferredoxin oxidoreductase delta subunit
MERVSIVRCGSYDDAAVRDAVRKAIELAGGIGSVVGKGDRVLLKPNVLTARKPSDGLTTHPSVVKAVAELAMEAGGVVSIGDCSGSVFYCTTEDSLMESGMLDIARELYIEVAPFEKGGFRKVKVKEGLILKEVYLANMALDADVVISLPKMKTHMETMMTGAVKNMFGCIPNGERKKLHCLKSGDFAKALLDIYSTVKPKLAVMDGIVAMEGNGPSQGTLKNTGVLMASLNPAALDVVSAGVMGFKSGEVSTNAAAMDNGLIQGGIEVVGSSIESVRTEFKRPSTLLKNTSLTRLISSLAKVEPKTLSEKCIGCGVCVESCPAEAIRLEHGRAVIDKTKCIRCYCCHELCPKGAVTLDESIFLKTVKKLGVR